MLAEAIETAINAIAPTWPLDRFIAVNPYWGRISQPFERVGQTMLRLAKSHLYMPLDYYREAWQSREIEREHLHQALDEMSPGLEEEELIQALYRDEVIPLPLPLLTDVLDSMRDLSHEPAWRDAITQQITQFCAAYFDRDQADWHPDRHERLYASWRSVMAHDHSVSLLMHAPQIRRRVMELPTDANELYRYAMEKLTVPSEKLNELLQVLLLRLKGWAAYCEYLRWQARLVGAQDDTIVDLLAIRLAWECLIDDGRRTPESAWWKWRSAWLATPHAEPAALVNVVAIWQRAQEIAYQRPLVEALGRPAPEAPRPAVQAAFCLDVREEVFRRALESVDPSIETRGFAGNFGLPITYMPLGTEVRRPQLPGLVAPGWTVTDSCGSAEIDRAIADQRRVQLNVTESWQPFHRLPGSAFTLVEALGLGYLVKIVRRFMPTPGAKHSLEHMGLKPEQASRVRPRLLGPEADRAELAERVLRAMGLTDFAPLVLLVGHGSKSANNPHGAALDCGACGGHPGDVNARALAGLLNEPAIRAALLERGLSIPAATHFVPALHNTTTDQTELLDRDLVPASHAEELRRVELALLEAGELARAERAPSLGLGHLCAEPQALARALKARASDWAQTRPEWGQANNASLIVAPRSRSRGVHLQGRAFLHDYDHRQDPDLAVLEQIMTGPMVVAHWINMQYYASTVDNLNFGTGDKILHNVVGGRIGVFEGNGGDLRLGLSLQSVHDGERWRHTPLRLSVFIEAPREAIAAVVDRHEVLRQLVDHRWIHLFQLGDDAVATYAGGTWQEWPARAR